MGLSLAFIGFGEVGQLFARELARCAGVTVAVHDILFADPAQGPGLRALAVEGGILVAASAAEACRGSDLVISAVTADAAIGAAREAAPSLGPAQTYIDLNSVSPETKREVAAAVALGGAAFVEFAVMAPVAGIGLAVPILAGGDGAERVAAALNPLGMAITTVDPEIGVASATKLCRSLVIKGLEALMVDLDLAAGRAGVMPAVLASLTASYPGMDWAELVRVMPARVRRHGVRRAAEMREASRMMAQLGLDGSLAAAVADRQERHARESRAASVEGAQPPSRARAG